MNFSFTKRIKSNTVSGIPNYGNTCYLNCLIQLCFHSHLFSIINNYRDSDPFVNSIKEIINLYLESIPISSELIQNTIKVCNFDLNLQYDVYDLLLKMLNILNDDYYKLCYCTILKCQNCTFFKKKKHVLNILNIPNCYINLETGITNYFTKESLVYNCTSCSGTFLTQSYEEITLPELIIIHLLKGNEDVLSYNEKLVISNCSYKLINSISRIGYNEYNGHFYNILINNNKYIKVSDDILTELKDFYDPNTLFLLYSKQRNEVKPVSTNHMENKDLLIDRKINRILCPTCHKLISIKHISEHQNNIHKNEGFSLKNYNKVTADYSNHQKITKMDELFKNNDVTIFPKINSENSSTATSLQEICTNDYNIDQLKLEEENKEETIQHFKSQSLEDVEEKMNNNEINRRNISRDNKYKMTVAEYNSDSLSDSYNSINVNNEYILSDERRMNTTLQNNFELSINSNLSTNKSNSYTSKLNLNSNCNGNTSQIENIGLTNKIIAEPNKEDRSDKAETETKSVKIYCKECSKYYSEKNIRQHLSRYHTEKLLEYPNKCGIQGCLLSYPTKA